MSTGYANAKTVSADTIPVVDCAALRDGSNPTSVASALHRASQSLGFIYIRNHGIDESVFAQARADAYEFFRGSDQQKASVAVSDSHRGWLAPGGARMHDDAKADLKESFLWGGQDADAERLTDHPLRGENQWPEFAPQLQDSAMAFFAQVHALAHDLMRGFALGLGLDQEFFIRSSNRPLSRASFVYYPQQPESMGADQFGVAPHTDFGVLTVLCQDDVGGLQIQDSAGDWIHAPPLENTLVVNVADLLHRWTGGAYPSTPHRVVNESGRERLSLVLAYDPNPETMIDARDVLGSNAHSPEAPITCGDYLLWRFEKAFAYRSRSKTN